MTTHSSYSAKRLWKALMVLTLGILLPLSAQAWETTHFADSSRLVTGHWVKIKVTTTGIHQITAADASAWGFEGGVSKLHVFGTGGLPISETLTEDIVDDLPQVPVVRTGSKLLFYAQGSVSWESSTDAVEMVQRQHPYSTAGYYFVTDAAGYDDIEPAAAPAGEAGDLVTTFTERVYHESELTNPGRTGRVFLGEDFSSTKTQTFNFPLDGRVSGTDVRVLTAFAANAKTGDVKLSFKAGGATLPESSSDRAGAVDDPHDHNSDIRSIKTFALSDTSTLGYTITCTATGSLALARLNYITVNYTRRLAMSGGYLAFNSAPTSSGSTLSLSGTSDSTVVWDVTTPHAPLLVATRGSSASRTFEPGGEGRREFVAFDPGATFPQPAMAGRVRNQNIHDLPTPDMVIVTPPAYNEQARRLAAMHVGVDSMVVHVLDQEQVFNEFSSGTPDAMAIRLMAKMFYDRGADDEGHQMRYLLLMGCGTYDNRLVDSEVRAIAYPSVLTWQSEASNSENTSYVTDDFFATLTDGSTGQSYRSAPSIAVGRLPVRSVGEATTMVDKIVNYVKKPNYGSWKNNALIVADDENQGVHMEQSESLISHARANGGDDMVYNRVYLDAFEAIATGRGRSYPAARDRMYGQLREGVSLWTYIGHASPNVWGSEGLLLRGDIADNLYYNHLPVLYAATCEFARFDGLEASGGEQMLLNPRGGVAGMICPARQAYIVNNGRFTNSIGDVVFSADADGLPQRLGDIASYAKAHNLDDSNSARFITLGDPAMRLSLPSNKVVIETINSQAVDAEHRPEFKARQTLTFTGHVQDRGGAAMTDFNGTVTSTLYDCEQSVLTHGYGDEGAEFAYQDRANRLSVNQSPVNGGNFSITLTVPSEIIANFDNYTTSLINLYAVDTSTGAEARGACEDFYIYGYDEDVVPDTIGPSIEFMGLNSDSFIEGETVNDAPQFMATISDVSGVNFSEGGIGHGMTLTLDDGTTFSDIDTYYSPLETTAGTRGTIRYGLSDLSNGHHSLRLKVWDVFNNSSERTIQFNVNSALKPEVYDITAAPNPASTQATFLVAHNRPDAVVTITLTICDLMGHVVWSATQTGKSDGGTSFPIVWNLNYSGGGRVPRGIYIYRASVSTDGIHEATKAKKIAVTAQ